MEETFASCLGWPELAMTSRCRGIFGESANAKIDGGEKKKEPSHKEKEPLYFI